MQILDQYGAKGTFFYSEQHNSMLRKFGGDQDNFRRQ